jgi:hypothetical protein
MDDLESFAKAARQYILVRNDTSFNWKDEDFLPAPPNESPPTVHTDVPDLDGSHGEDVPISQPRRSSDPLYRRADEKKKRVPSAPVFKPGEDNAHLDRRTFLQHAHAAEAWQPLHLDALDDSYDWPILLLRPGPDSLRDDTRLGWLYKHRLTFPRQFARWCKRHLDRTARDTQGLGGLDSFAKAADKCYFSVTTAAARDVYDWNKDELVLEPPQFTLTDLHRLHYRIAHEPRELQDWFHRQLDRNVVRGPHDIQERARDLTNVYIRRDIRVNWSQARDRWPTRDPATLVTSNFPLEGVRADGHWTVRHHRQPFFLTIAKSSLT